jgi:hypothetical protein
MFFWGEMQGWSAFSLYRDKEHGWQLFSLNSGLSSSFAKLVWTYIQGVAVCQLLGVC